MPRDFHARFYIKVLIIRQLYYIHKKKKLKRAKKKSVSHFTFDTFFVQKPLDKIFFVFLHVASRNL